jgi:hypothetical protein
MKLEDDIREALEAFTRGAEMPQDALTRIRRRTFARRVGGVGAALALVAALFIAVVPRVGGDASGDPATFAAEPAIEVPDVIGMLEGDAFKVLMTAGLEPSVQYVIEADAPVGRVLETIPAAGAESEDGEVTFVVARSRPESNPPTESDLAPLARITEPRPEVFVGVFRDAAGDLHVVFNPGIDVEDWRAELESAVPAGKTLYLDRCSVTRGDLLGILDVLEQRSWSAHASEVAFAAGIDPASCSVVITSQDLTAADRERLVEMFGPQVTFDMSGDPSLWGS